MPPLLRIPPLPCLRPLRRPVPPPSPATGSGAHEGVRTGASETAGQGAGGRANSRGRRAVAGRAGSACTLSRWLILEIPWETEPADATRVRSAPGAVCATAALGGRGMLQDAAVRRQCGSAQTEAGSSDVDESHLRALAISLQSYPRFVKGCGRSSYQPPGRNLGVPGAFFVSHGRTL